MREAREQLETLQAARWEQRAGELTLELRDSQRAVEELQLQLQGKVSSSEVQGQRTRQLKSTLEVVQEDVPAGPYKVVQEDVPAGPHKAPLEQRHQRGWKPPQQRRSTGSGAGAVAAASAAVPRLRGMPAAPEAGGGSAPGSLCRSSKNINTLPMDLRGLGKLLTGGGVTPRHR